MERNRKDVPESRVQQRVQRTTCHYWTSDWKCRQRQDPRGLELRVKGFKHYSEEAKELFSSWGLRQDTMGLMMTCGLEIFLGRGLYIARWG